jgi:hypothetical protein
LNSVKAHIRKEFIETLSNKKSLGTRAATGSSPDHSLRTKIPLSLIYHYFQSNHLTHSLSVLLAECGYESHSFLSDEDLKETLKISSPRSFSKDSHLSSLELLVEEHSKTLRHQIDSSSQTDLTGPGIREILDNQIKELHLNYVTRRETERVLPNKTIEERMISYQRECEERIKREYELQVSDTQTHSSSHLSLPLSSLCLCLCLSLAVPSSRPLAHLPQLNHIRTVEISAIKHDEGMKMRLHFEQLRLELEHSYQQRLSLYDEKETQQKQALLDSERKIQQLEYDSRQRIQRELDEVRGREEAHRRKNEMEFQTTKLLETRLKEMQVSARPASPSSTLPSRPLLACLILVSPGCDRVS